MTSQAFKAALDAVGKMEQDIMGEEDLALPRKEPLLVSLPYPITPAKARELAYNIQKTAPARAKCFLLDEGDNVMVTCVDGLVFHAMILEGRAHVCAAEGLLEIAGGETARA